MDGPISGLMELVAGSSILLLGFLVFVGGKIPAAIHAFKNQETAWAITLVAAAPFFPPLGVLYCLLRWREGRIPCLVMVLGILLMAAGLFLFFRGFLAAGVELG